MCSDFQILPCKSFEGEVCLVLLNFINPTILYFSVLSLGKEGKKREIRKETWWCEWIKNKESRIWKPTYQQ